MANDEHLHLNETQRIEAFSDGVFAIAITLLIIEIIGNQVGRSRLTLRHKD